MNKLSLIAVVVAISISGCGGGGSGTSAVKVFDGVFKDSNVQGLNYVSGNQKGITKKNGEFKYEEGSQVAFSVGGVDLGSALGKAIISPIDLVANGNLASDAVINRVRFLMMLDKNNVPSDGIEISSNVQAVAKDRWENIDFSQENFDSDPKVIDIRIDASVADSTPQNQVNRDLPSKEDAVAHLRTTLLCSYAGGFNGTYSGTEAGNVAFVVDPASGKLGGSSYNPTNQVSVEINSTSPIDYDTDLGFTSAEDSGKEFSGNFASTDALSGAWVNSQASAEKGNFTATRLGGESDAVYRYAAPYAGLNNDEKGVIIVDVLAGNKIEGKAYNVISGEVLTIKGSVNVNTKKLDNATLSDGTIITGTLGDGVLSGNLFKDGNSSAFFGSGCKLN